MTVYDTVTTAGVDGYRGPDGLRAAREVAAQLRAEERRWLDLGEPIIARRVARRAANREETARFIELRIDAARCGAPRPAWTAAMKLRLRRELHH